MRRELIVSVTDLAAAANWFMTLGALGSADRALAARRSLEEETEMVLKYPNISSRLCLSFEAPARVRPAVKSSSN